MTDPLSSLLQALAVDHAVPLLFESCGPYRMRFAAYEHLKFGAVLKGGFSLQVDGEEAVRLDEGDAYLLTDGRPYRTFNDLEAAEIDGTGFFARERGEDGVVRLGDGPPDKVVIGGRLVCDPHGVTWLRAALPPLVHVRADNVSAAPLRMTLQLLRSELVQRAPGQAAAVEHLAALLLVQAIRAYAEQFGPENANWLSGLADPRVGRAMRVFHADVARDWTVEALAREAGMSRSSFAARFLSRVGMSPMDYVAGWRLHQVRCALRTSEASFAEIAAANGYRSRAACSQAFRRLYGCPPGAMRAKHRLGARRSDA